MKLGCLALSLAEIKLGYVSYSTLSSNFEAQVEFPYLCYFLLTKMVFGTIKSFDAKFIYVKSSIDGFSKET